MGNESLFNEIGLLFCFVTRKWFRIAEAITDLVWLLMAFIVVYPVSKIPVVGEMLSAGLSALTTTVLIATYTVLLFLPIIIAGVLATFGLAAL